LAALISEIPFKPLVRASGFYLWDAKNLRSFLELLDGFG